MTLAARPLIQSFRNNGVKPVPPGPRQQPMPDQTPPAGCVSEPTFYLEDRKGSVRLKCYVRQQKIPGGGFGELCLRLEWTLTGQRALTCHLQALRSSC